MGTFLAVAGFFGFMFFIITAIVSTFRKTGKGKKRMLYATLCFVVMIIGGAISPDVEPSSATYKTEIKKDDSKKNEVTTKQKTEDSTKKKDEEVQKKEETVKTTPETIEDKAPENKPLEEVKKEIDTSVFVYAKSVEVTDAIDINQHVTVFVEMSKDLKSGLATQHVINQSYDFLQQPDLDGAKTVTIAVKQGEIKIAQITINKDAFVPDDDQPMSEVVIKASKIDSMTDEVKEFGATMGSW
ncbi:hypothetical protein ACN6MT_11425 [Neobacillus niacini]|uniref:hypothetical protein n=1 Tax=Neobacillus niacini TaxID=86668 RepID=UPI003B021A74